MKKKQRILTASVTVLAAATTAHLMQRGSDQAPRMAAVAPAGASILADAGTQQPAFAEVIEAARPDPALLAAVARQQNMSPADAPAEATRVATAAEDPAQPDLPATLSFPEMPRIPADALMPALPENGPDLRDRMATLAPATPAPADAVPAAEVKRSEFGLSCGTMLTASAKDAAMVGLTLTDPCRGKQTFTIEHGPLRFTARLDQLGTYMAEIPALDSDAQFTVRFADGSSTDTQVEVPAADGIDRALLFSDGHAGLQIHALEFGADYGQPGHVWSGNPRSAKAAARAGGGFVTVLGDAEIEDAQIAEIYTFPPEARGREGVVRLSIEAEVTALNCGRDVAGRTLQKDAAPIAPPVSITLAMPDCDAIGEYLVLKNLLRDLKIASN